jgi:hypothetical protein
VISKVPYEIAATDRILKLWVAIGILSMRVFRRRTKSVDLPPAKGYAFKKEKMDLFDNPVGCLTSLAKCKAFCGLQWKLFGNLKFPNNSNVTRRIL